MKKLLFILFLSTSVLFFIGGSAFAFKAFDDKLDAKFSIQQTMNIKTHESVRDIRYNSFRTTVRGEFLYDLKKSDIWNIKFYTLSSYFYDYVLDIDSPVRHAIKNETGSRSSYRHAQRPRDSEEWLKELYIDISYKDVLTVRLGKQIVSWGETAEEQVADIINPLDVKFQVAFPDWEDYKLGLWMARIFYTPPDFWQDLAFELIVIPFNFVEQRVPVAGHGFWVGNDPVASPIDKLLTRWRHDCPSENFKNFEIGFRLKGYANILEGVDWYLSHFYTRSDTPVADGADGYNNFIMAVLGFPVKGDVVEYPFYNSTALSFSTTWSRLGLAIRGESTYTWDRDYHYGPGGPIAGDVKDKDLVTTSIAIQRYTIVPFFSGEWNRCTPMSLELAWYNYWMLGHEYDKTTGNYIMGDTGKDSTKTKFTFSATAFFFNNQLVLNGYGAYNVNGGTLAMVRIVFWPTNSWQFVAAYQQFNEDYIPLGRYFNQVILSAKFDF